MILDAKFVEKNRQGTLGKHGPKKISFAPDPHRDINKWLQILSINSSEWSRGVSFNLHLC
jgi:hypothetical protein